MLLAAVLEAKEGPREWRAPRMRLSSGGGALLTSGSSDRRLTGRGAFVVGLGRAEASERGGDGGVGTPDVLDSSDFEGGGVDIIGDEVVVPDASEIGDFGLTGCTDGDMAFWECSLSIVASARRSFSRVMSDSMRRSESSSRSLWVSMRSVSLSCSPARISSSSMTPLSMETLYLDSRSSSEDDVFRA